MAQRIYDGPIFQKDDGTKYQTLEEEQLNNIAYTTFLNAVKVSAMPKEYFSFHDAKFDDALIFTRITNIVLLTNCIVSKHVSMIPLEKNSPTVLLMDKKTQCNRIFGFDAVIVFDDDTVNDIMKCNTLSVQTRSYIFELLSSFSKKDRAK